MKVVVHDRTGELPTQVRAYAERKLGRLSRHFDRVVEAEVEFDRDRRKRQEPGHSVQVIVHTDGRRHNLAQAVEVAGDPRAALDLALDKVDRQVVKLKEKVKVERKKVAMAASVQATSALVGGRAEPAPERIRVHLRPQTLADAERDLAANGLQFRVYLDEDTGAVAVLYRKADGSVAVIEPVIG